jgi:hypothetical protein
MQCCLLLHDYSVNFALYSVLTFLKTAFSIVTHGTAVDEYTRITSPGAKQTNDDKLFIIYPLSGLRSRRVGGWLVGEAAGQNRSL